MRRHGGTPADDATWRSIVGRAEDAEHRPASGERSRRTATRLGWAAAAAVVALVVGAAAVIATRDADDGEQVQVGPVDQGGWEAPAEEWERLPDPPLSPRDAVMSAWTGEELLVFGGTTWTCPPGADCMGPEPDELLTDGAALDPKTGEWRTIAPMSEPMFGAPTAVVGDDVYVLQSGSVWRYSISEDRWDPAPTEPSIDIGVHQLVAAGDRLVAVTSSDEGQDEDDYFVLDEPGAEWRSSWPPGDLLPLMYDRSAVWSAPYLYVFGKELVPNPGSEEPSLTIGARVDLDSGEWERLPDSEILGPPSVASDGLLVSPHPGGADGGEVNGWGRTYPYGGIFDTATQTWRDLPPAPGGGDRTTAGVIGSSSAWFGGSGGDLFDTTTVGWTSMPALEEAPGATAREGWAGEVHTAGLDSVVVGGVDWSDDEPELLGDAWIWRSGRSGGPSASEDPAAGGPAPSTTIPGGSEDEVEYFVAATVLDDGSGPQLCLGGVALSLPPQCGGPPIEGWDWDAVDGESSHNGVSWGHFEVVGTYDGTTFTLTEPPAAVDSSDDPELLDAPPGLDRDFTAPCPEPAGGWQPADPAVWDLDAFTRFTSDVRSIPGFAGFWYDNRGIVPDDPTRGIHVVAIAGGSDAEDAARQTLASLWGGPICVTSAARTYRELQQIQDEAGALVEAEGETLLGASTDEVGNIVQVQVIAPAPELQAELDERFGEGTVVLFSALRRLA
jgi:hypothetical protein